ncbi:SDR family oxidoreductase [Pendulispora brunnea]|uniref:SDR family oxidoreductase n=1 Tax=Pendulispora brunnea TaxID=2905690 RepID=A0ABZ2KDE9_9BACT
MMSHHASLAGKVAVVTGASSGVGRALARAFGDRGASVALIARTRDALDAAAEEIVRAGGRAMVFPLDVSDAQAVESAADRVVAEWGCIDIWLNDAMVSVFAPVMDTRPEEYRRVMEVNYLGYVHGTLSALKHMRARNQGLIVQIGSALAYRSIPLQSAYCASKAAIRGFTDSLRSELVHDGSRIRIVMLQLPAVNTPQFQVVRNRLPKHPQPVPPIYQPEVIAEAALYAVEHPARELWIGWSTLKAIVGQRLFPGLLDRYLARRAYDAQQTDALRHAHADNVDVPVPGDRGAHGEFDRWSRRGSTELWLRMHRHAFAAALFAMFIAVGIAAAVPQDSPASDPYGITFP